MRKGLVVLAVHVLGLAAAAAAPALQVLSAAPQGVLTGEEQVRIQIVFSAAVVPLGEVQTLAAAPSWLTIQPPLLARWRWAGTAELVGEPQAPLPKATTYTLTVGPELCAVDGAHVAKPYTWSFTTPLPSCTAERSDEGEDEAGDAIAFSLTVRCNQRVDPASLAAVLDVKIEPRPLPEAPGLVSATTVERWEREQPAYATAWKQFLATARGPAPGRASFRLTPDPAAPQQVFTIAPEGAWPASATLRVAIGAGLRSLEGPHVSTAATEARFRTAWPFAPRMFAGRTLDNSQFDPESVSLKFSTPVRWKDLLPHLHYRVRGTDKWLQVAEHPDAWWWDSSSSDLRLSILGLPAGKEIDVCLGPEAEDTLGQKLGFEWCGVLRTGHRPPSFYLVEGDGVLEWEGPHLLPLRVTNVLSYRLRQRRVEEEELVPFLSQRDAAAMPEGQLVEVPLPPDKGGVLPVSLDPVLGGKPGIVYSEFTAVSVLPGSEYNDFHASWLREPRSCVTQVTSLGLTVKTSRHEGTLVWVTRLADATPVAGASVTVRHHTNQVLWRGRTDTQGLAQTPPEISGERVFLVTARVGEDVAYAKARWFEGHRGWDFNLPVDYAETTPAVGLVWADRGVVRPGERVHVKTVLRRQEERGLQLPDLSSVSIVFFDPNGNFVEAQDVPLDRWGAAETELAVPEAAQLGLWDIVVGPKYDREHRNWIGDTSWRVRGSFRVAEFRRPKFRVHTEVSTPRLIAGDGLAATIEGKLLAGGAMAGAKVAWTVRAERTRFAPAGSRWAAFEWLPAAFVDIFEQQETITVAEGHGELDRNGMFGVRLPRVEGKDNWPARLEVEAEVTDLDQQSSVGRASVLVLPGEVVVGLQRPGYFLQAADGVLSSVAVLSPDGTAKAGVAVRVQLVRRHWESVRRREVSGRYVFESRPIQTVLAEQSVTSSEEPVPVRFELQEGGEYALVAQATDSRSNTIVASTDFYVFGGGYTPWRMDQENRIELVAERGTVKPGEIARVLVKSPWEKATALVTLERAGVLESRVMALTGTMPLLEFPIAAEHIPNVFVSVVLLRGRVDVPADPELVDPGRPAYRIGACALSVPPVGRRLQVAVKSERPEYRPGQTATALVSVRGEEGRPRQASLTIWAVDAGVLDLTSYHTPDLFRAMYEERGLAVSTAESRSRLVGRRSYGTKGDKTGGGGGREAAFAVRQDFRALAVWRGDVVTDAQGRATVSFTLPDSLTTYRLMAVAVAGQDEFGSGESEVLVTKPLGLEPALPRFLRPEDKARAGVVVRNRTKDLREVEVTLELEPSGPVALRGTPTRIVKVAAESSVEVGFGLVGVSPGTATLRFKASSLLPSRETDAFEIRLPVLAVAPTETVGTFFAVRERATEAVAVPTDVFPSAGGLELHVAASPLVEAGPAVNFLADYPHACAEQVASQVLGLVAAARLGGGLGPSEIKGKAMATWLQSAVSRLQACQRPDGGFAFWPEGWTSYPELSAHVVWALAEAQETGIPVDENTLARARDYLSALLRRNQWPGGEGHGWTVRALALHALGALGQPEPAYFQELFETRQGSTVWGRALLAATIARQAPQDPRLAILTTEIRNHLAVEARVARLVEPLPDWSFLVWASEPRASASALLALSTQSATDPIADRLVRGLVDHLSRDRYHSTHDVAWMLQALALWQDRRGGPGGPRSIVAELDGDTLLRTTLAPTAPPAKATVPMGQLHSRATRTGTSTLPLVVRSEGGEVHAAAIMRYTPRGARPAIAQGLEVERTLLDSRGQPTAGVPAGEEVVLEIAVKCPAIRRFVAVEVPLPAGLEALDPNLATTARRAESLTDSEWSGEEESETEEGIWWVPGFDHAELRDDRVVLYATMLPAGTTTTRVRCRATTTGTFLLAPAHAEQMYEPEVFASTPASSFEVLPAGR